jgi:hypothetical protein
MVLTVSEIKKGDKILIPSHGKFIVAIADADASLSKTTPVWMQQRGVLKYRTMRCRINLIERKHTYSNGYEKVFKEYESEGEFKDVKYFDINHKQVWLVKREEE